MIQSTWSLFDLKMSMSSIPMPVALFLSFALLAALESLDKRVHKSSQRSLVSPQPYVPIDKIHFSGEALEKGYFWVILTALFSHASVYHLVNNSVMFFPPALILDSVLGKGFTLVSFLACGAAGWLTTYVFHRFKFSQEWDFAGKFISSCGSSPGTYGVAFLAAVAAPRELIQYSWAWAVFLCFGPSVFSSRYRLAHFSEPKSFAMICILVVFLSVLFCIGAFERTTAEIWMILYFSKVLMFRFLDVYVFKSSLHFSGADNMSHLGGAALGIALGWYFHVSGDVNILIVSLSFLFLFVRIALNL